MRQRVIGLGILNYAGKRKTCILKMVVQRKRIIWNKYQNIKCQWCILYQHFYFYKTCSQWNFETNYLKIAVNKGHITRIKNVLKRLCLRLAL